MEKKINLEEILEDYGIYNNSTHPNENVREKYLVIKAAMKEAVRQGLDLAAENAETCEDSAYNRIVDKQSILNIINLVE